MKTRFVNGPRVVYKECSNEDCEFGLKRVESVANKWRYCPYCGRSLQVAGSNYKEARTAFEEAYKERRAREEFEADKWPRRERICLAAGLDFETVFPLMQVDFCYQGEKRRMTRGIARVFNGLLEIYDYNEEKVAEVLNNEDQLISDISLMGIKSNKNTLAFIRKARDIKRVTADE